MPVRRDGSGLLYLYIQVRPAVQTILRCPVRQKLDRSRAAVEHVGIADYDVGIRRRLDLA